MGKKALLIEAAKEIATTFRDYAGKLYADFSTATVSAIEAVDASKVDKRNGISITIPTSGWTNDTSVTAYPYKYEISVSSITAKDLVTINIAPGSQAAATACRLCPTNETIAGKIRIRAAKIPSSSISAEYWIEKGKET